MGCCCSAGRANMDRTPIYVYYPRTLENEPLTSINSTSSSISAGLLVDTNLDTSIPDTYRPPPAPLPYDVGLTHRETSPTSAVNYNNKSDHIQPQPPGETVSNLASEGLDASESLKGSDCKSKLDDGHDALKLADDEPKKLSEPVSSVADEDDVCPICLDEYDLENPRIVTKCEHHYHLACILEWMERSDTCPVCDQMMMFDQTLYE